MENKKNKIRVAVIGYGHLGKWHCQKIELIPDAELTFIVDQTDEQLLLALKNHPRIIGHL